MNSDPFTMALALCDVDGIVRRGAMHHDVDYPCTGHAHFAGEHIRCTNPAHDPAVPVDTVPLVNTVPLNGWQWTGTTITAPVPVITVAA